MAYRSFTVHGLKELQDKLEALPGRVAVKILREGLKKAAEPMLHAARSKVPVDTGLLASSLTIRSSISVRKQRVFAKLGFRSGPFKGDEFYGAFIEFGHRKGKRTAVNRGLKGKARKLAKVIAKAVSDLRPFVPARPFLRPAFDENKTKAVEILKQEIATRIEAVAKEKP